jgi:LmbE family N-acetylglucosaminyl deacetylase
MAERSMLSSFRRALVLGAHCDDEFGCAGTIMRLIEAGVDVAYAAFSACEESVPPEFDREVLRREVKEAIAVLGILEKDFFLYDVPVRHFPTHRQEILESLIQLRAKLTPDLVLLPALSDIHQDHAVVAHEGVRAFKHATILGYELPMNTISSTHTCFVELERRHVERKLVHARCYRSQQARPYFRPEFLEGLAAVRGVQMNVEAAEAFEVIRLCLR